MQSLVSKGVPWLRVLIEGVVIVGSILLGFGIDAWWEGRQEEEAPLNIWPPCGRTSLLISIRLMP